jgi:hypothetical protein
MSWWRCGIFKGPVMVLSSFFGHNIIHTKTKGTCYGKCIKCSYPVRFVGTCSDTSRCRRNSPRRLCVSAAQTNASEFTQTAPCLWLHTQLTLITPLQTQSLFQFDYTGLLRNVYLSVQNHYPHLASKQGMGTWKTAVKRKVPQPHMFFKSKDHTCILAPKVTVE